MMPQQLQHYRILGEIGSGGMSIVYRAQDTRTGQHVALKVLHPHLAQEPRYLKRFQREALVAMTLDSPYAVKVLDHGQEDGLNFLVMELVLGTSLEQYLTEHGPLPVERALEITRQVAHALNAAHRHGIVHRDIKPKNIMLLDDGAIKVMDFGIAWMKGVPHVTQVGSFVGSPHYTTPEQIQGQQADIRSDIYSLGATLYRMLAGVAPFEADTPWGVLQLHLMATPAPIRQRRADVPPAVESIVQRCLAKQPDERYQTPGELLAALRAVKSAQDAVPARVATPVAAPAAAAIPRQPLLPLPEEVPDVRAVRVRLRSQDAPAKSPARWPYVLVGVGLAGTLAVCCLATLLGGLALYVVRP